MAFSALALVTAIVAASDKYQKLVSIRPDFYEAMNNWGIALANQAREFAKRNLPAARVLWHKASEKYQRVLRHRPDDFEATYYCGVALANEALGLAESNLPTARNLSHEAGNKYKRVLCMIQIIIKQRMIGDLHC